MLMCRCLPPSVHKNGNIGLNIAILRFNLIGNPRIFSGIEEKRVNLKESLFSDSLCQAPFMLIDLMTNGLMSNYFMLKDLSPSRTPDDDVSFRKHQRDFWSPMVSDIAPFRVMGHQQLSSVCFRGLLQQPLAEQSGHPIRCDPARFKREERAPLRPM